MVSVRISKNYQNVTTEWLDNATPNSHKVLDRNYFKYKGIKYKVDDKNVVLDYSKEEREVAEWLENTFGGKIYMNPRINNPKSINTSDFIWNNEHWDLKNIIGNGKHTLDSAIKKNRNQAFNFVFDISKSNITNAEAIRQLKLIFKSKDRQWVQRIILKKNDQVIVIFKNKKRD